jgi:LPS-assembly protein
MFKPWGFSYSNRYSFDRGNFLESIYSAEYRHQCWSVTLSYRDKRVINPGQSVTVSFNLLGAFGFGSAPGDLSGKYGPVPITGDVSSKFGSITGDVSDN